MPKVLCCSLNAESGPHFEILQKAGFEVAVVDRSLNLFDEAQMTRALAGVDATLAGSEPYTRAVIENSPQLKVISRTGVGFDAVDLAACDERGVVVTTTPGVNHHSVAEHTLAMLLAVARGWPDNDQRVREGRWRRLARPRVMGRTLGIVGLGRIGKAVAWRAAGLGMQVLAYEPHPDTEFVQQWRVELVSFDDLLARSDFVSLHLPATAENHHLMNAETFAKMRQGSILLNTARGRLVDERALYDALKSGHLRGAGLDVFETEPLPTDSPLLEFDNVLTAGHLAGLDAESHEDTFVMAAKTIAALRDGEWPAFCIQNLRGVKNWTWQ
jgi:D-3-phosphoglycerate dehydrogenase